MVSVLQRMALATPQRPARINADQLEAGLYIISVWDSSGFDKVGTHELKTYVDVSLDKHRVDDHVVKRFDGVKRLVEIRRLLGSIGYKLVLRVCVDNDRIRGKYENEHFKQCLTLIYDEIVRPST